MEYKPEIWIIEDDPDMIDLMRPALERRGFRAIEAGGVPIDLALLRARRPDLILLDLAMPGVDGWKVYGQLKVDDELGDIPVIVFTDKTQILDKVLALQLAKVAGYLTKPFDPRELLDVIDSVLGKD